MQGYVSLHGCADGFLLREFTCLIPGNQFSGNLLTPIHEMDNAALISLSVALKLKT